MDECDVVVPRNRVAEFIKYSHSVAQELGLRIPYFGHAGDGNLHLYLCRDGMDDELWQDKVAKAFDRLYKKAGEFGGLPSGEHGIGSAKKQYLLDMIGADQVEIMAGIKKVFDPNGILNPGKIFG
jgi:glycolate oxidase